MKLYFCTCLYLCIFASQLWAQSSFYKVIGHPNNSVFDEVSDMTLDLDQNIYLIHHNNSFGDFTISKFTPIGNHLWSKGFCLNKGVPYKIITTADSSLAICGITVSTVGSPFTDISIVKLDTSGAVIWSTFIRNNLPISHGSVSFIESSAGNLLMAYSCMIYDVILGINRPKSYILNLDSSGNILWFKAIGNNMNVQLNDLKESSNNHFIIAGSIDSIGFGESDIMVVKIDSSGNFLNAKIYGDIENENTPKLHILNDGGLLILARMTNNPMQLGSSYFIQLDSSMNIVWNKRYPTTSNEYFNSSTKLSDNNYLIASNGNMFIKIDSLGNILWQKVYGNTGWNPSGKKAVELANGDLLFCSQMYNPTDVVLVRANSLGESACYYTNLIDFPYTSPTIRDSTITIGVTDSIPLVVSNSDDIYSLSIKDSTYCISTGLNELSDFNEILKIYPNPVIDKLNMEFSDLSEYGEKIIIIYEMSGRVIYKNKSSRSQIQIDLSNVNPGLYIVNTIVNGQYYTTHKIIKLK